MAMHHHEELQQVGPDHDIGIEAHIGIAKVDRAIITQFDRFPHRNAVLGRESTPAEIEFLKQPGSSF